MKGTTRTFWLPPEHHSLNHPTRRKATTHDLHHPHVVDVEVFRVVGHDCEGSLCDKSR